MTVGPITAAVGFALMTRLDATASYLTQLLPGLIVFALGLAATVAPLTAAILGGIEERHAGIASAINNAIARVAGLLAVAAIGSIIAARFASSIDREAAAASAGDPPARAFLAEARRRPFDTSLSAPLRSRSADAEEAKRMKAILNQASGDAMHAGLWSIAALLTVGGLISAIGIRNPHAPARRNAAKQNMAKA
jgi:hypothetical protein